MSKRKESPMQYSFWMKRINPSTGKNYTEDEAKCHIRTFRKSNLEYWTSRGYSIEDAVKMRRQHQKMSGEVAISIGKNHPEWKTTKIEYWLSHGYSLEEARKKLSERQKTFSLETCVKKYGEIEGKKIYEDRQVRWQRTLNSKSVEEMESIRKKRNSFRFFEKKDVVRDNVFFQKWKAVCEKRGMEYFDSVPLYREYVIVDYLKHCFDISKESVDYYMNSIIKKVYYLVLGLDAETVRKWILEDLSYLGVDNSAYYVRGSDNIGAYHLKVKEGILLSLSEIIFYSICKKYNIDKIEINKCYPNSRMKFDFSIGGYFIEISNTMMGYDEYLLKQRYKQATFGSIILVDTKEFEHFIVKVLIEKDDDAIRYYTSRPI